MAVCAGCGTEFAHPAEEPLGGSFRRPPRPEAASIVLRSFSQEASAQQAVVTLRNARIEAYVATDDCGGLYPPLSGGSPFRLIVSEVHREAAEQVLAGRAVGEGTAEGSLTGPEPTGRADSIRPPGWSSAARSLGVAALSVIAGILLVLAYQRTQEKFSGTVQRDLNHDGRIDEWDTYDKDRIVKVAGDNNGDEQPDIWYYYEDNVMARWEADCNFDGKVDVWGAYDTRGVTRESKSDLDFDGNPDVTHFFQFGLSRESHYVLPGSGLIWKKEFYTNGLLREELLDRNRDGRFDAKLLFDVFGVEVSRQKLD